MVSDNENIDQQEQHEPGLPSAQAKAQPVNHALDDLSRKRKHDNLLRLSKLDELSSSILQGEHLSVEEKQRKMNVIYSRRKRVRQSQRLDELTEMCVSHREENRRLHIENQRLDSLLLNALMVLNATAARTGGHCIMPECTQQNQSILDYSLQHRQPDPLGNGEALSSILPNSLMTAAQSPTNSMNLVNQRNMRLALSSSTVGIEDTIPQRFPNLLSNSPLKRLAMPTIPVFTGSLPSLSNPLLQSSVQMTVNHGHDFFSSSSTLFYHQEKSTDKTEDCGERRFHKDEGC